MHERERVYERGRVYVNQRTGRWVRESGSVCDRERVRVRERGFVRVSMCKWFSVGEQRECVCDSLIVRVRVGERAGLCIMR